MKRNRHRRALWIPLLFWQRKMQIWKKVEKDRVRAEKSAEAGNPKAITEYEEYCRNEEKKRERSKTYFKERYRKEQEKYKATKELEEQGGSQAVELLMEYDRRIEHKREQMARYNWRELVEKMYVL